MAAQESGKSAGVRRFRGIRWRPSGRWVAEIKDSMQRVRLSLGTFDTVEDASCAYDEAARALRGDNTRTNFAARHGAAARLSKNLQHVMARATAGRSSSACGAGVGDQFTLAAVFRDWQQPALSPQLPLGCRVEAEIVHVAANSVQPCFVVPRRAEAPPPSVTVGEAGDDVWAADVLELDGSTETSAEKAFKVSSSVIVSSKFDAPPESFGLDGL